MNTEPKSHSDVEERRERLLQWKQKNLEQQIREQMLRMRSSLDDAQDPNNPQMAIEALRLMEQLAAFEGGIQRLKDLNALDTVHDLRKKFPNNPIIQGLCDEMEEILHEEEEVEPELAPPTPKKVPRKSVKLADFEGANSTLDIDTMALPELPENLDSIENILERSLGIAVDNNADIFSQLQALKQLEALEITEDQCAQPLHEQPQAALEANRRLGQNRRES